MFDFNQFFAFAPEWSGATPLHSAIYGAWVSLSPWNFWLQMLLGLGTLLGGIKAIRRFRGQVITAENTDTLTASFLRHMAGWWLVTLLLWLETWSLALVIGGLTQTVCIQSLASGGLALSLIKSATWVFRKLMRPHDLLKFSLWCIEWLLIVGVVLSFLGLYTPLGLAIQSIRFNIGDQVFKGQNIVEGVLMAVVAFTFAAQMARMAELWLQRYAQRKRLHENDALFLSRIFGTLLFVGTTVGVLTQSGIEGSTLAAFGSALGIGLGFGLQQVVVNFFSGLNLLVERTIKLGDFITIDKITGKVIDLNRQAIVVRDGDGTESLIPNASITRGNLQNHTLSNPDFRVSFSVPLRTIEDFPRAREIILGVLDQHPRVLKEQPRAVTITAIYEDYVGLEVSLWINDLNNGRKPLISELYLAIGLGLKAAHIRLTDSPQ